MAETREQYLERRKRGYLKNIDKIAKQNHDRYVNNKEVFKKRKEQYVANNKEKNIASNKRYRDENKYIISQKAKTTRLENLDKYNSRQKELRKNRTPEQKEREKQYRIEYRKNNKDRIKEYQASRKDIIRLNKLKRHHKRYREDEKYKMTHNLRSRIKNALNGKMKDSTSLKLLGCTMAFFKKYIEELFTDGMCWDKIKSGEIHIDHKLPCSSFDLTNPDQQKKCFHWSNLQPLWALDNLKKSDKICQQ